MKTYLVVALIRLKDPPIYMVEGGHYLRNKPPTPSHTQADGFQLPVLSLGWEIIQNTNIFVSFQN